MKPWQCVGFVLAGAAARAQDAAPEDGAGQGPLASAETSGPTIDGQATLGMRFLRVDGDARQYAEDSNLDAGLFVHDAELRVRGLSGWPIDSLLLRADGVGDPVSAYRLEALGGPWRTHGRYERSEFVGNAQADQHPFDVSRAGGSIDFEYHPPGSVTRSDFGFDVLDRDGLSVGSRSVGFESVAGFPVREEERSRGAHAGFATEFAGWRLDLTSGVRTLADDDQRSFALPSPAFPDTTLSEDFHATGDGHGDHGRLRLRRDMGDGARLELGYGWQSIDLVGDAAWHETGFFFDPSEPFVRDTQGDLDLDRSRTGGDADLVLPLSDDTDLDLGYVHQVEQVHGKLERTIVLDELQGDPPSVLEAVDTTQREEAMDLVSLGANSRLGAHTDVDLELDYGGEDMTVKDVSEDVTVRHFDGRLHEFGGQAKLHRELGEGWSGDVGAGHSQHPAEGPDTGANFDFAPDRTSFVRLDVRWRGARCSAGADARVEHRTSDALTSRGDLANFGLSFSDALADGLTLAARASFETFDLESDTTFLVFDPSTGSIDPVPGQATFDGHALTVESSVEFDAPPLRPNLAWSASLSSGDSRFAYLTARLSVPCHVAQDLEIGIDAAYLDFQGDEILEDSNYDALVLELFVRRSWGR